MALKAYIPKQLRTTVCGCHSAQNGRVLLFDNAEKRAEKQAQQGVIESETPRARAPIIILYPKRIILNKHKT